MPVLSFALTLLAAAAPNTGTATVSHAAACRTTLTVADARELAAATPNSRAFVTAQAAVLKTSIASQNATSVTVRVSDSAHKDELVGLYTVNLRSGAVLDDDQEPAEDAQTSEVREQLMARHCRQ